MNNKNNKNEMGRVGARVGGLLVSVLFAVGFGWVGLNALGSLTAMLHTAWMARSWQAVPAEVLESRLLTSSDSESTTFAVHARYRYEWAGRSHESTRIGLDGNAGSDNIDDWHQAWDTRLRAAREGNSPIRAWVDPLHPDRAVLDRQLRWRKVLFMLPFAVLFPLVAIAASFGAWSSLRRAEPTMAPSLTGARHVPQHFVVGRWLFAIMFCVLAFAAVGMASGPSAPGWVWLIAGLFVLVGLTLLWAAVQGTRRAWTYRGSFVSFQPSQPRSGAAFLASWTLPPRASNPWAELATIQLRVAQYRIDDSGSSTSERLAEHFTQDARPLHHPDGGLSLQARFELPSDAPSQGARRSGEKVDWRLEWLDEKDNIQMAVPIPIHSAMAIEDSAGDRLSRDAQPLNRDIPPAASEDAIPSVPAGVQMLERPDALVLDFGRARWRSLGILAVIGWVVAFVGSSLALEVPLLALSLYALSRRWTLEVRDDGMVLERVSWLWRRRADLPASCLPGLYHRQLPGNQSAAPSYVLWARGIDRGSDLQLTPGLRGSGAIQVAQMLRWALAQRGGRFSPGMLRNVPAPLSRPGWGWLLCLLWLALRLSGLVG
ncbi:hypothetical protein J2X20_004920 [Pelomonas saccharophila]|uniref:DUF3592 domain-containing protein n=1 Tax=Roseateles saccharophilus TaxID=304 RepID=A0ABU1YW91_ROSSA|nr:DUF3592 domain-containing protein [Roseateles saccharophilus]MDR7272246.1 hypothetical protein [Roseateles saccharophilus]